MLSRGVKLFRNFRFRVWFFWGHLGLGRTFGGLGDREGQLLFRVEFVVVRSEGVQIAEALT